jgi:hypothetical protein
MSSDVLKYFRRKYFGRGSCGLIRTGPGGERATIFLLVGLF